MAESVRVAVRVRPFNSREKERKATLIIGMSGNTTTIKDPEQPKAEPRKFAFDYSYWSHDGFKDNNGYLTPSDKKYADQAKVFEDLGRGVLANAWKGYNTSLFAYGQTGSGKSYSMVGYGANKGIVPVASEELFKGIEEKRKTADKGEEFQVTVSMLEIYSEQVRDLLNPVKQKGGLKVGENPGKGFVAKGLKTAPVNSYKEIESKIDEGTKNRTVAATNMNATSSRAHTIVAINFTQKSSASGQSMTKSSVINLVDLAGSERAESTGATGDRLKEGSAINQSLSSLGNVIKALADQSMGNKKVMVPYRDSVLTKLLKNALGGNSKTVMIAALSPADINYSETLSTLRFADRAKSIKTQAVINESPTDKLIRELREENAKLMEMLKKGGGAMSIDDAPPPSGGYTEQQVEEMKRDMEEKIRKNQEEMEEMNKTWEQRMAGSNQEFQQKIAEEQKKTEMKKTVPHFWNLNEDEALTAMIIHFTPEGKTVIGNGKAEKQPDIALTGLGIQNEHAIVMNKKDKVSIKPCSGAKLTLNGNLISSEKELHHHDRIVFGSTLLFVFHHPKDYAKQEKSNKKQPRPTFETAQEEIAKNSGLMKIAGKGKSKEDLILQEELVQMMPMVAQCNAMSEELDKKVDFKITLVSPQARGQKEGKTEVCVNVKNLATGNEFLWDRNKFINRKFMMEEIYQNFVEGEPHDVPKENDPFLEDVESEQLIGNAHVFLQSLGYMIDMNEALSIMDHRGNEQGKLQVAIVPCKANGNEDIGDDFVDDPSELVGKALHFKVKISGALGIPKKYKISFCKYKFFLDDKHISTSEEAGMNPNFKFANKHSYNPCTEGFVKYLTEEPLIIEVYGRQKDDVKTNNAQLNTKELMKREKTKMMKPSARAKNDMDSNNQLETSKLTSDVRLLKKRQERANEKLSKIQGLVNKANEKKEATIKVEDLEKILSVGYKFRAAVNLIALTNQAKKDNLGKNTSQACVLQ